MTVFPRVAVLDGAPESGRLLDLVVARGYRLSDSAGADVLVAGTSSVLDDATTELVRRGTGLVVLAEPTASGQNQKLERCSVRPASDCPRRSQSGMPQPPATRPRRSPTSTCSPASTPRS